MSCDVRASLLATACIAVIVSVTVVGMRAQDHRGETAKARATGNNAAWMCRCARSGCPWAGMALNSWRVPVYLECTCYARI